MSAADVGATVLACRSLMGVSQADLAPLLGVHVTAIGKIERGERTLTWEEGVKLRALIGFATDDVDDSIIRDAAAYRRILAVIGEREARDLELERVLAPHAAFADKLMKIGADGSLRINGDMVESGSGTFS